MALRAVGHSVVGYARRAETRRRALELGAADEVVATLPEAAQAEVVILAPPVLAIRRLLPELAPHLRPGTVVTDVASTKVNVEGWARRFLPREVAFVGGHPMAGKETAGIEYAEASLFRGRTWCVVPPEGVERGAVGTVLGLAGDAGATTLLIGAAEHDRAVAATSHLPFTAAAALCLAVVAKEGFGKVAPVAGSGLRDTTRLASGDALMHRDICLTNRDNLVHELEGFAARVTEIAALLKRLPEADLDPDVVEQDAALGELEALFVRLKEARDSWLRNPPLPPASSPGMGEGE
ncbi:MAG TPA: prephenate dehydrogenase [Chloroflexota bacterium]|jgi:prephenate dehydrogenase|nr:prephenate dehydrogenase [Chloroflexota bacterium]